MNTKARNKLFAERLEADTKCKWEVDGNFIVSKKTEAGLIYRLLVTHNGFQLELIKNDVRKFDNIEELIEEFQVWIDAGAF